MQLINNDNLRTIRILEAQIEAEVPEMGLANIVRNFRNLPELLQFSCDASAESHPYYLISSSAGS